MIKIIFVFGVLVASVGSAQAALKNCNVPRIHLIRDVTVTGYMYVKAGKSCSIIVANSLGPAGAPQVMQRPSHGAVTVSGLKIRYTPRTGFVGKDSFGYMRNSIDGRTNQPAKFSVNVEVTVEP